MPWLINPNPAPWEATASAAGPKSRDDSSAAGALTVPHRVIAHVDLDAFFASVEQLLDPRLAGQPVVVGGAPNQRGVVASASYEARARGIRVPMPLTRAYRVCPQAHFLHGHYDLYRDYSRRVFDVCRRFSPALEQTGIDEGYLDWRKEQWPARSPGQGLPLHWPADLAANLRAAVHAEVGLHVTVGLAATRLMAKIAAKYCKPRGICHVAPGAEPAFLRPMPLRVTPGIGARTADLLAVHGLRTFADVQDRSDAKLEARLGLDWAARLRRLAEGRGSDRIELPGAPKSVSNERTFSIDCRDRHEVRRVLYRLTEKAAWRLRRAELKAGTVTVKLRTADFRTHTHSRSFGFRTDCHQELYLAAAELLDRLLGPEAVRLVGIHLSNLDACSNRQLNLYDGDDYAATRRTEQALDLVRRRFGFGTIMTAGAL